MKHTWSNFTCPRCGLRKRVRGEFIDKHLEYVTPSGEVRRHAGECTGDQIVISGPDESKRVTRTTYEVLDFRRILYAEVQTWAEADRIAKQIGGKVFRIRRTKIEPSESKQLTLNLKE